MEKTTTRPARIDDAPFIAWVMQEAARSHLAIGIWDVVFPGPDEQRLKALEALNSTEIIHFGHWSRFLVAQVNGKNAAALSAYEPIRHGKEKIGQAIAESFATMEKSNEELAEVPKLFASIRSLGYVNHDGFWIIEWVATLPEFRGRGLINQLLLEVLEKGRTQGFKDAQIGYILGNVPAKNAYEKVGFKHVKDYCHPDYEKVFGTPGMASMNLKL